MRREPDGERAIETLLGAMDHRGQIQVRMDLSLSAVECAYIAMIARMNGIPPGEVVSKIMRDQLVEIANQRYRLQ